MEKKMLVYLPSVFIIAFNTVNIEGLLVLIDKLSI